jgi:hypothetical protein
VCLQRKSPSKVDSSKCILEDEKACAVRRAQDLICCHLREHEVLALYLHYTKFSLDIPIATYAFVCVWVGVSERERERERDNDGGGGERHTSFM